MELTLRWNSETLAYERAPLRIWVPVVEGFGFSVWQAKI